MVQKDSPIRLFMAQNDTTIILFLWHKKILL